MIRLIPCCIFCSKPPSEPTRYVKTLVFKRWHPFYFIWNLILIWDLPHSFRPMGSAYCGPAANTCLLFIKPPARYYMPTYRCFSCKIKGRETAAVSTTVWRGIGLFEINRRVKWYHDTAPTCAYLLSYVRLGFPEFGAIITCRFVVIAWATIWAPSQYKDRLIYVWRFPC